MKFIPLLLLAATLTGCGEWPGQDDASAEQTAPAPTGAYGNLSAEELRDRLDDRELVLLDVRTPREVAGGKIEGALEIDFRDPAFASRIDSLDRSPTYVVYCAAGGRSNKACALMAESGFERIYNLEGGFTAWQAQ